MSRNEGGEVGARKNLIAASKALTWYVDQYVDTNGHLGGQGFGAAGKGWKNVVVEVVPMVRGPHPKKSCR